MPKFRIRRLPDDIRQQAVVRRQKNVPFGVDDRDIARRADTGVDHRDMHGTRGEIAKTSRQPEPRFGRPMGQDFVGEIDDANTRGNIEDPALHDADERIPQTEI